MTDPHSRQVRLMIVWEIIDTNMQTLSLLQVKEENKRRKKEAEKRTDEKEAT